MKCNGCSYETDEDLLDSSGFCYGCANYDPDPQPDLIATTVLAAKSAFEKIVKRFGRKVDRGNPN